MSTVVSGLSSYCSGAQFLVRYDVRTAAELLPDADASLNVAQVAESPTLIGLLKGSSGKLEAAALAKGAYTPADLAAFSGTNMGEWIADIVADLTAPKVLGRRWIDFPEADSRLKEAEAAIEALAKGERIFGLQEVIDAGTISDQVEQPSDVEARNMITLQSDRYFGHRANRW